MSVLSLFFFLQINFLSNCFCQKSINFSVHYQYVLKPVRLLDLSVLCARERMKFSLYTSSVNGRVDSFLASGDFVVC